MQSSDLALAFAAFAAFARVAAPLAVSALWQGTVVAAGLMLCLRLAPRISASQRFLAWSAAFAVVVVLPFLPSLLQSAFAHSSAPAIAAAPAASHPLFALSDRWALVIAALWIAAAAFRLSKLVAHTLRLRALWKSARPVSHDGAQCSPQLCTTQSLDRPSVIGFFRPRILIPDWLFSRLTPGELEQVILHEAEHLRRRDDWTNLIEKICLVFFPLNPALAWIDARLSHEREMACDEGVVRRTQAPRAYAACLASLAERGLQYKAERHSEALSLAAWRRRSELVHRVHSILRRKQSLHPALATALLSAVAAGLAGGSIELARSPQLVTFVAPPPTTSQPATVAALQPGLAQPQLIRTAMPAGYRAIPTKAILPDNPNAPAILGDAPLVNAARRYAPVPAPAAATQIASRKPAYASDHTDRAQMINADLPQPTAAQDQPTTAQFVVFTAVEQISAAPRHRHLYRDYETDAQQPDPLNTDGSQPDTHTSSAVPQLAVTRLIFQVEPASATAAAKSSQVATPQPGQRVAVPFGNGWLVFQL